MCIQIKKNILRVRFNKKKSIHENDAYCKRRQLRQYKLKKLIQQKIIII
jgi:hypothetical protein